MSQFTGATAALVPFAVGVAVLFGMRTWQQKRATDPVGAG